MARFFQKTMKAGLRQGAMSGNKTMLRLAMLSTAYRLAKRFLGNEPKVVYRERLEPGEKLVVTHREPTKG